MGLLLVAAGIAWVAILVVVVAACRAAAQGDTALRAAPVPAIRSTGRFQRRGSHPLTARR